MRLMKSRPPGAPHRIVVGHADQWYPVAAFSRFEHVTSLVELLDPGRLDDLAEQVRRPPAAALPEPADPATAAAITGPDTAVWGAGLNYHQHRQDLDVAAPGSGPGSYLRPGGSVIDNGGRIELPTQSERVTAEAELGLVIGTECKNVRWDDWRSVVAGVTAVLDMTAEDVIRKNPRYIPWAKGFDTFCSIGPALVTLDEVDDPADVTVTTIRNGDVVATATTSEMMYDLGYLVEYFSAGRTLAAGTVICTGTPGAAVITDGDSVQAVVDGVGTLTHTVVRAGAHPVRPDHATAGS